MSAELVSGAVERVLRHERAVIVAGIVALTALAWVYIVSGAGVGMPARDMTQLTLFPHLAQQPMHDMMAPMPIAWTTAIVMWWVMMIAMMTPSAAPLVLLYGRVLRHRGEAANTAVYAPSIYLVAGYLTVWLAFAIIAAALEELLQPAGLASATLLGSKSAALSAALLAAAGLYQLSPLKSACLRHCRGPVEFLTRHWRPGRLGAFAIGLRHGAWCVGCCWLLMALLFVGGIMNLAWIAALTILVLVEKLTPAGPVASRISGVALLAWAVATVLVQAP